MPGPRVTAGDRVSLRTVESEDAPFVQRGYANPEIRVPMGHPPPKNRDDVEDHIEDSPDGSVTFLACADGENAGPGTPDESAVTRLGLVNVADFDWKRPELAYWLVPEHHGEGYGKATVALAVDYTFRQFDAPAVTAAAYDFNEASRGLLESLGFEEEGRLRKQRYVDGRYVDAYVYGLLREAWEER